MSSREETFDLELERLFKSMDEIEATDELKASTLTALFERLDEEDAREDAGEESREETTPAVEETQTMVRPALVLVTDDAAEDAAAGSREGVAASAAGGSGAADAESVRESARESAQGPRKAARPRRRGFRLKVAAALLVVAVGLGGFLSYAMPASHVKVSAGDTTFDLGVNVYGTTVSATANSDAGKTAISSAEVRNVEFEVALERLLSAYDQARGGEKDEVQVTVNDPFGGGERISSEAERVLEGRKAGQPEHTDAPAQTDAVAAPSDAGGRDAEGFSAPNGGGANAGSAPSEGPVAEGGFGGGTEPSGGADGNVGTHDQTPQEAPAFGGGAEGSLGGGGESSNTPNQGANAPDPGAGPSAGQPQGQMQGQGQPQQQGQPSGGTGGAPR